jgi:hypothetical protein
MIPQGRGRSRAGSCARSDPVRRRAQRRGSQAGNDGVDVFDGECDAADARRVRRLVPIAALGRRRVKFRPAQFVRGLQHRDICPNAFESHHAVHPAALDRRLSLQLESSLTKNSVAAARSSTTMPTCSIPWIAMCSMISESIVFADFETSRDSCFAPAVDIALRNNRDGPRKAMNIRSKRILLVDLEDARRSTRVELLRSGGYEIFARTLEMEVEGDEGSFDLIIVTLHDKPESAAAYSDRVAIRFPDLPILLLADQGVSVPPGTVGQSIQTGSPEQLRVEIAAMLNDSIHIRQA